MTELLDFRTFKVSQRLCRIRDKQGVNFTLAVYSRKRRVDWRTLAKKLFKSFLSALSFFRLEMNPEHFLVYLFTCEKKSILKKEVSWKYKPILGAVMLDTVDPS